MSRIDQFPQKKEEAMTGEKLRALLQSHSVPLESWGVGEAKTVDDLLSEIREGEAKIVEENGELFRSTRGLAVDVFTVIGGKVYRLKEDKQVFTDGRVRERRDDVMDTSMGEKLTEGESREEALQRAIQQELSIDKGAAFQFAEGGTVIKERQSGSFPGLKSRHQLYRYDVLLPEQLYKQEGYVEVQPTKSTYFVWEEVQELSPLLKSLQS